MRYREEAVFIDLEVQMLIEYVIRKQRKLSELPGYQLK